MKTKDKPLYRLSLAVLGLTYRINDRMPNKRGWWFTRIHSPLYLLHARIWLRGLVHDKFQEWEQTRKK